MNPVLFSSAKQDWTTPKWLFAQLDAEFGFEIDAAASPDNALCPRFFTEADDALTLAWRGRFFLNPPYGKAVDGFVRHAWEQVYAYGHADRGAILIAARTDTRFWRQYALRGAEVRFVEGRLKFGNMGSPAPFPSAVLVFDRFKTHPVAFSTIKQPRRSHDDSH